MGVATAPMFTLGIVAGSLVLTWLYRASSGSVLIAAVWHGCYNLATGTAAASGLVQAVVSAAAMMWATAIIILELRARRHQARHTDATVITA